VNQLGPDGGCRTRLQSWGAWLAGGMPGIAPAAGHDSVDEAWDKMEGIDAEHR
jgi:hypothetical protein